MRRVFAASFDLGLELGGGFLGSYFGALIAALAITLRSENPVGIQSSIWSGMQFGFVFCFFAISIVNRIVIQGLSGASLGKKLFKLEIQARAGSLSWSMMFKRFLLSHVLGFKHEKMSGTQVVFEGQTFTPAEPTVVPEETATIIPFPVLPVVLSSDYSERPTAMVIQLHQPIQVDQEQENKKKAA